MRIRISYFILSSFTRKILAYRVRIEAAFASFANNLVLFVIAIMSCSFVIRADAFASFVVSYSANVLSSSSIRNKTVYFRFEYLSFLWKINYYQYLSFWFSKWFKYFLKRSRQFKKKISFSSVSSSDFFSCNNKEDFFLTKMEFSSNHFRFFFILKVLKFH